MKNIKITEYSLSGDLPDPFAFDDGSRVQSKEDWIKRKKEIYKTAVELQYGTPPPKPEVFSVDVLHAGLDPAVYRITAGTKKQTVSFDMTVFKADKKSCLPTVISGDACFHYGFDKEYIKTFTDNGINIAFFNRTALFPDVAWYNTEKVDPDSYEFELMKKTVEAYDAGERVGALSEIYPEYSFGAIAAWAWGYSRCVDALEMLGFADMSCIAFTGHSRGGKTAMLAGALDERAAIVNPNEACAGGCSCYRLNIKAIIEDGVTEKASEPLSNIVHHFPLWLGKGMREYIGREDELPFDSHFLKALVAPRVLFVSEAASDIMANPVGSWQTTMGAKEVYRLLGKEDSLIWYYRSGAHYHTLEDIGQLVNVIRHFKYKEELNERYFNAPFDTPELAFDWRAPKNK